MKKALFQLLTLILICSNIKVSAAGSISGNTNICVGTSGNSYPYSAVGYTNPQYYNWVVTTNGGAILTSGQGTPTITVFFPATCNDVVTIALTTAEGTVNLPVFASRPLGAAGPILGPSTIYTNVPSQLLNRTYTTDPVQYAQTFTWNKPAGTTIVSQTPTSITLNFSSTYSGGAIVFSGGSYSCPPATTSLGITAQTATNTQPQSYPYYSGPLPDPNTRDLTTKPVGSLGGSVNVSSSGASSYSIPIMAPPGTAGMQPNVSINYSSNAGTGLLGKGWDLSASSAIVRTGKNIYMDGKTDGVNFDATDKYALDGNRLISINGVYGGDRTEYRTEYESFSKITSVGLVNNAAGYFTVETKDGKILEYGRTLDSHMEPLGRNDVLIWYLDKVTDKFGNYMKYNYYKNYTTGESMIASIEYTGNQANSLTPYNKIEFIYGTKSDPGTNYIKGSKVYKSVDLQNINVYNETALVKKYIFNYSFTSDQSTRLVQIIENAPDGTAYNSTMIYWGNSPSYSVVPSNTKPSNQNAKEIYGDFNGDGRLDWIQSNVLYLADQSGYNFSSYPIGTSSSNEYKIGDFNGDGMDDLLECSYNSTTNTYTYTPLLSTGTGFTRYTSGQFTFVGVNELVVGDFNGDGLMDCFVKELNVYNQLKNWKIYSCTGAAHNTFQPIFSGNDFPNKNDETKYNPVYKADGTTIDHYVLGASYPIYTELNKSFLDFDGDGKTDLVCRDNTKSTFYKFDGTHFVVAFTSTDLTSNDDLAAFGDFNGDGNIDILVRANPYKVIYTTGTGTFTGSVTTMPSTAYYLGTGDFNGDGKTDILYLNFEGSLFNYYTVTSISNGFSDPVKLATTTNYSYSSHVGDFNGDGTDEFYFFDSSDQLNHMIAPGTFGKNNQLVKSITNGLNLSTTFTYFPISNAPIYTKGTGATFPVADYQGPMYVVSSVKSDNGIGGQSEIDYTYAGLKIHRQGKGILGFAKTTTTNIASGIKVENTLGYNTQFYYPYTIKTETKASDGQQLSVTYYTNSVKDFTNLRIFPYISQVISTDTLKAISQTSTFLYDDYGNQTSATTNHNGEGTTTVTSTYVNAGAWCLSKPDASAITKVVGTEIPYTRTIDYTYNTNGQVLTAKTDAATTKWTNTAYEYNNPFGLPTKATVTGADITGGSYTSYEYDTKSRFAIKTTNNLGQYSTATYHTETGSVWTSTDINGLTTTYGYDVFGRSNLITAPDNNFVSTSLYWKDVNAPANALYYSLSQASGAAPVKTYYDRLGRVLRQVNKGLDGTDIYMDKIYNTLGQLYQTSEPYFAADPPEWTTYSYDTYGRSKGLTAPTGNATISYSGRTVTTTNTSVVPQQVFTKTINAFGQLVSSSDPKSNTVSYTYYSNGKPKNITSPGSAVTSMTYDAWGNQTQLVEPNAGNITYTYDAFHQLLTQTKNGVNSSLTYDGLGRVQTLTQTEGTTTYTYDTKPNGKGMLAGITAPGGVAEDYNYDSYSRPSSKTETIDGLNFTESMTYDSYSRLYALTYPSGFAVNYNYNNYGYLSEITRGDNSASIWKAQIMNARGQITQFTSGNGLVTAQTYDHGFTTGIQTGAIQNLQYSWDETTGNLSWRKDANRNLTENFTYDNLDRLTGITGNTNASYTFAPNGNITSSTPAGNFTYNASKLNAVETVSNPQGLISATNQNISYTSFDKVSQVIEGAKTVNLYYGADQERRKMVLNDGVGNFTRYYAHGNYEKETGANARELFYITAGTGIAAIYEKKANTSQMYYVHKDHLGSVNVITNESKAVVEEMSFDAWGRRRNPTNWSYTGVPTTHIIDRGYTGHEHLDGFGLINMNGRMYDPVTGRFLSPDNHVGSPDNTQSYNRFSYCMNNPLKYTDPSGWDNEGQYTNYWEYFNTHNAFNFGSSGPASTIGLSNQEWMNATNPGRDNPDYQQMVAFNRQNAYTMAGVAQYVYDRDHSFTLSVNGEYLGRVYVVPGLSVNIDVDVGDQSGGCDYGSPGDNWFSSIISTVKGWFTRSKTTDGETLVLPTSAWLTQLPDMGACFRTCQKMIGHKVPYDYAIFTAKLNGSTLTQTSDAAYGASIISAYLDAGYPIIVGVNMPRGIGRFQNPDGTTDHFIVIAGYGYEDGQKYYRYYDPGAGNPNQGTNPCNRLYLNDGIISGPCPRLGRNYTVSQVREGKY